MATGVLPFAGDTPGTITNAIVNKTPTPAVRLNPAIPADTRVAAVGPATARALRGAGLPVDLVPATGGSSTTS